jgi:imidazolonepropionase-like amidohydrolase
MSATTTRFLFDEVRTTADAAGPAPADTIVASDGRIVWLGRSEDIPPEYAGLEAKDIGGIALPGLIDGHTHITLRGDGATYEEMDRDPDELLSLIAIRNLHRHLRHGVTTIRDNGGRNSVVFAVREAAKRGYAAAPRMLLSGRPLTPTGGHFAWCNGVADDTTEIRRNIRRLRSEGADHIKIMASGGGTAGNRSDLPSFGVDDLRVAIETAHELGMRTTAHCHAAQAMRNAIDAGVDCIEHGYFYIATGSREFVHEGVPSGVVEYEAQYDGSITEAMLEKGIMLSATVPAGGYHELLTLRREKEEGRPEDPKKLSRRLGLERRFERKFSTLAKLMADGMRGRILITTDAGPLRTEFGHFTDAIRGAVEAGMTVDEALAAATIIPAQTCGLDDAGALEVGRRADVLVVDGDPRQSLDHLDTPRTVLLGGEDIRGLGILG